MKDSIEHTSLNVCKTSLYGKYRVKLYLKSYFSMIRNLNLFFLPNAIILFCISKFIFISKSFSTICLGYYYKVIKYKLFDFLTALF